MDKKLFDILACPLCKGNLHYRNNDTEIICRPCGMAFPIDNGIPIMLENKARTLTTDERLNKSTKA